MNTHSTLPEGHGPEQISGNNPARPVGAGTLFKP